MISLCCTIADVLSDMSSDVHACPPPSRYDQYLFEDGVTNRMHESLTLFEKICTSEWLLNTSMILFLNKHDLFAEKIQHTDMTAAFPEYTGGENIPSSTHAVLSVL